MKIPLVRDVFSLLCPPVFPAGWGEDGGGGGRGRRSNEGEGLLKRKNTKIKIRIPKIKS